MWDVLFFLLGTFLDVPLTWTGERVMYILSAGRRKPRFTAREIILGKRDERFSEFASRGWLILVGVLFWAALGAAVLAAVGPLKPIHEWRS
jgi:hypothetical protein